MKTVFTNGCFDILHEGHVKLLRECKRISSGGKVIVGLNSDSSIKKIKGENRPINSQDSRKFILESLRFVDEVIVFDEETPEKIISLIRPDVLVKGSDYSLDQVVGKQYANEVVLFPLLDGFSTTSTIKKLA